MGPLPFGGLEEEEVGEDFSAEFRWESVEAGGEGGMRGWGVGFGVGEGYAMGFAGGMGGLRGFVRGGGGGGGRGEGGVEGVFGFAIRGFALGHCFWCIRFSFLGCALWKLLGK